MHHIRILHAYIYLESQPRIIYVTYLNAQQPASFTLRITPFIIQPDLDLSQTIGIQRHLPRVDVKAMKQHGQRTALPQLRPGRAASQHGCGQKGAGHQNNNGGERDPAPSDVDVCAHFICCAENGNAATACSHGVCHRFREAITEVW
jgi:hypothetical protein